MHYMSTDFGADSSNRFCRTMIC